MSSRPMGWTRKGVESITRLRIDKLNGIKKEEIIEIFKNSEKKQENKKLFIKVSKIKG